MRATAWQCYWVRVSWDILSVIRRKIDQTIPFKVISYYPWSEKDCRVIKTKYSNIESPYVSYFEHSWDIFEEWDVSMAGQDIQIEPMKQLRLCFLQNSPKTQRLQDQKLLEAQYFQRIRCLKGVIKFDNTLRTICPVQGRVRKHHIEK